MSVVKIGYFKCTIPAIFNLKSEENNEYVQQCIPQSLSHYIFFYKWINLLVQEIKVF